MENKTVPKEIYKLIVKKLKEYKWMQDEILDIETQTSSNTNGIKSKNKKTDAVANFAIRLAENEYYQELKAWRECINKILIKYINEPAKLKFFKRRYIDCELLHFKAPKKYKIKDKYVIADLELEGYQFSEITWKRWKYEMIYELYTIVKKNKYIKNI